MSQAPTTTTNVDDEAVATATTEPDVSVLDAERLPIGGVVLEVGDVVDVGTNPSAPYVVELSEEATYRINLVVPNALGVVRLYAPGVSMTDVDDGEVPPSKVLVSYDAGRTEFTEKDTAAVSGSYSVRGECRSAVPHLRTHHLRGRQLNSGSGSTSSR